MICGDHVCINKAEANKYFEDNLSIEVKIIETKKKKSSLIEINLSNNSPEKREINITGKEKTNQEVKVLSNDEINKIKKEIKLKKKQKKIVKKIINTKEDNKNKSFKTVKEKKREEKITYKNDNKLIKENERKKTVKKNISNDIKIVDVCAIIEKCSIDEISNFLLKEAKKKKFPDITTRE